MTDSDFLTIVDKIFLAIFGRKNTLSLDALRQKFAFDIKLPTAVKDTESGKTTYTAMPNVKKYMICDDTYEYDRTKGWMLPKKPVKSLQEILDIWDSVNYTTTERVYDSENVVASDPIYGSVNVYASTNCGQCKNILFCDGVYNTEFSIACQRSDKLGFCLRVDDSNSCTNSYNVICSNRISNSFFIQDASNLNECMFCSHISDQEYCIANMKFTADEYFQLKPQIVDWILRDKKDVK